MKLVTKIAIRVGLLILIVVLSNFIYKATTFENDLRAEGNVYYKMQRALNESDVIYFSASPNAAIADSDKDRRTIGEMMDDFTPTLKVMTVDTGGIHAGIFKTLIEMIPANSNVKRIVVNMNYRSFGYGWIQSSLENAIQKQVVFYNNRPAIINRFLQGLNFYDALPENERERIMQHHWKNDPMPFDAPRNNVTDWCAVEKWGDWTNPKRQLADHYIKNFAFVLNDENPRIKDFDEIVSLCKAKNIELIFVILPENLDEASYLVDDDLVGLMVSNKNFLVNRYNNDDVSVIDCFNQVPDSCFIERVFPSEHYTEFGRTLVAKAVSDILNSR